MDLRNSRVYLRLGIPLVSSSPTYPSYFVFKMLGNTESNKQTTLHPLSLSLNASWGSKGSASILK